MKNKNIKKIEKSERQIRDIINTEKIRSIKALTIESDYEKVEKKIELLYNEIDFIRDKLK